MAWMMKCQSTVCIALAASVFLVLSSGSAAAQSSVGPPIQAPATTHQGTALKQPNVPCTCRFRGDDYQIGERICVRGPQGPQMAQCAMTLNNTSWTFLEEACPTM